MLRTSPRATALPRDGDILVSKQPARIEHEVRILPSTDAGLFQHETDARAWARAAAAERHVDAWLTEDLCHFLKIASHREG